MRVVKSDVLRRVGEPWILSSRLGVCFCFDTAGRLLVFGWVFVEIKAGLATSCVVEHHLGKPTCPARHGRGGSWN